MNLSLQYPAWFFIFCLLAGAAYAGILYYGEIRANRENTNKRLLYTLTALRFLSVSIIAFLLLSPFIKISKDEVRKPVIVLLQDNSQSIGQHLKDTSSYSRQLAELSEALEKDFKVVRHSFGNDLSGMNLKLNEKITDISGNLQQARDLYLARQSGAVILATDGIYNKGSNPIYGDLADVPVYTIALGDTQLKKDLFIQKIYYNRIAFLNDKIAINVDVKARHAANSNTAISLFKVEGRAARRLTGNNIRVNEDNFEASFSFTPDADKPGIQHYRVVLNAIPGESTTANNTQDIYIEVLDSRQKILLLAFSPHPDLSALKQSIESSKNYEVSLQFADKAKPAFKEYNMIILHQLPNMHPASAGLMRAVKEAGAPVLYIIGSQTSLPAFNDAQQVLQIRGGGKPNEAFAAPATGFELFSISEQVQHNMLNFPPLSVPYGEYRPSPNAATALYQRIGAVNTKYPLLLFSTGTNERAGVLCGEGIWRWRLHDFMQNKNHEATNELITRIIQYLAVKEEKKPFRVLLPKRSFDEGEPVTMDAELYNASFRLFNDPDASIKITNDEGRTFNYVFNKTENAYTLNTGPLPTGSYSYEASVQAGGKLLRDRGMFSVSPLNMELVRTDADHRLLYMLSNKSGGEMVFPGEMQQLAEKIRKKEDIKPTIYTTHKTRPLVELKWVCFLILLFIGAEWFIRKWNGGY